MSEVLALDEVTQEGCRGSVMAEKGEKRGDG